MYVFVKYFREKYTKRHTYHTDTLFTFTRDTASIFFVVTCFVILRFPFSSIKTKIPC